MIYVRQNSQRGHADRGWLQSWHSFSFADYYDPNFMGFSTLRVINEDIIQPGQGFPTHGHKDMEILTYVMSGTIEHKDSMGNTGHVNAGEFQIMSAGTGVRHSEYSLGNETPTHLYQIWITPAQEGITPRYEQKVFDSTHGRQLILSPDAEFGSLKVYQDMRLWRWALDAGQSERVHIQSGRKVWIQVVRGNVRINNWPATVSDGVAVWDESEVQIETSEHSEILLFDLPPV